MKRYTSHNNNFVLYSFILLGLFACDDLHSENTESICCFQNPEDLALLPNTQQVIVSEYGGLLGERAGVLSLLDLSTNSRQILYAGEDGDGTQSWGASDCSSP